MPAANLTSAALRSFTNLNTLWLANTMKAKVALFAGNLLPTFQQQHEVQHPVSNWLTLLLVVSSRMPTSDVQYRDLTIAANYMYRCCFMTDQLSTQSLISGAQAAAVLAEYNLQID